MKSSEQYGAYIREKRIEKGMTQADVAKKLGISQQAYSRYERGDREPSLKFIVDIAQAIDFNAGEFFSKAQEDQDESQTNLYL